MRYRIKLESFRSQTINDYVGAKLAGQPHETIKWYAHVVDNNGNAIQVDGNYGLGYDFGNTKEEALLNLRAKLAAHEHAKREIEELNLKVGEIVEIDV